MLPYPMTTKFEWRNYVTPKLLRNAPIHRWLVFPHSFTGEIVEDMINKWNLNCNDTILDPFAGAGTTLLAAKKAGIPSKGYDISPFAVLISRVKTANYVEENLREEWETIKNNLIQLQNWKLKRKYPDLIHKAFSPEILLAFEKSKTIINRFAYTANTKDFFLLALLAIIPLMSRARATGGWLKWIENNPSCEDFLSALSFQIELMLRDVRLSSSGATTNATCEIADARKLSDTGPTYSAIITSPPYPNRHDYTRVFGVELMFGFLDWDQTRSLRYQSLHSHPEAKPQRPSVPDYVPSAVLQKCLTKIKNEAPLRIAKMLDGYFLDLFCCFKEMKRVSLDQAKIAVVLGNAQYYGEPLLVDEFAAEIGESAGLTCTEIIIARIRGNSAQQMKKYGRKPSRESIVIFKNG